MLAMLTLNVANPGLVLRGRTPVDEIALADKNFRSSASAESFLREQESR